MSSKIGNPRYRRLPEQQRKQLIIDATLKCLASYSLGDTTVRRIAEIAGVTPGLVTHHFKSKEELIAEAYRYLSEKFLSDYRRASNEESDDPIERLRSLISVMFQPQTLDRELLKIWTSFWTLVLSDKRLEAVHQLTAKKTRNHLCGLIKAALLVRKKTVDESEIHELSIAILSLLDGMWLAWGLDPDLFEPDQARGIAFEMISARLDLPELRD